MFNRSNFFVDKILKTKLRDSNPRKFLEHTEFSDFQFEKMRLSLIQELSKIFSTCSFFSVFCFSSFFNALILKAEGLLQQHSVSPYSKTRMLRIIDLLIAPYCFRTFFKLYVNYIKYFCLFKECTQKFQKLGKDQTFIG